MPPKWVTFLPKILRHGSHFCPKKSLEEGPISPKKKKKKHKGKEKWEKIVKSAIFEVKKSLKCGSQFAKISGQNRKIGRFFFFFFFVMFFFFFFFLFLFLFCFVFLFVLGRETSLDMGKGFTPRAAHPPSQNNSITPPPGGPYLVELCVKCSRTIIKWTNLTKLRENPVRVYQ